MINDERIPWICEQFQLPIPKMSELTKKMCQIWKCEFLSITYKDANIAQEGCSIHAVPNKIPIKHHVTV